MLRHRLILLHVLDVLLGVSGASANGINHALGLANGIEMNQSDIDRLPVRAERPL